MIVHRANAHGIIESFSDCSEAERNRMARRAATDRKEEPQRVADAIAKVQETLGIMDQRYARVKPVAPAKPRPTAPRIRPPKGTPTGPHALRKLTDDQVREIRRLAQGAMTHRAIGEQFGVSKNAIWGITSGRRYQDVE